MNLFQGPVENDPRMTQGPCEKEHVNVKIDPEMKDKADFNWGGSRYGLWVHCPVCDLRLGYWPKEQWTGKHAMNTNPAVVEQALQEIKKKGHWEKCTAEMVKIEIQKIELNKREKALKTKSTRIESQKIELNNREKALETEATNTPIKCGARGSTAPAGTVPYWAPEVLKSRTARSTGQASEPFVVVKEAQATEDEPLEEAGQGATRAEMESQIAHLKRELKQATLQIEEASKADPLGKLTK